MEVNSPKNMFDPTANRGGKTRLHFNEFTYNWTVERYSKFKRYASDVNITSPTIIVYNCDDKYEFQLQICIITDCTETSHFVLDLNVISCPTRKTNEDRGARVAVSAATTSNGNSYSHLKSVVEDISGTGFAVRICSITPSDAIFSKCDSDGNLNIICDFTFHNGHSHTKPQSADLETASALSRMSILDEYEKLLHSAKFSDVTLIVGDKKFPAHKNILASRSPVFSAMFEHNMLENKNNIVEITDVEPEIMAEVLRFIYAGKVKDIKKFTADLLVVADIYQIEALKLMCEEVFIEKLSPDNVAEILELVDQYESCQRLRKCVLQFLSGNAKEIAGLKNYSTIMKSLSPSLLIEVTKAMLLTS